MYHQSPPGPAGEGRRDGSTAGVSITSGAAGSASEAESESDPGSGSQAPSASPPRSTHSKSAGPECELFVPHEWITTRGPALTKEEEKEQEQQQEQERGKPTDELSHLRSMLTEAVHLHLRLLAVRCYAPQAPSVPDPSSSTNRSVPLGGGEGEDSKPPEPMLPGPDPMLLLHDTRRSYMRFLAAAQEHGRRKWTVFDLPLMTVGIGLMLCACVGICCLISRAYYNSGRAERMSMKIGTHYTSLLQVSWDRPYSLMMVLVAVFHTLSPLSNSFVVEVSSGSLFIGVSFNPLIQSFMYS